MNRTTRIAVGLSAAGAIAAGLGTATGTASAESLTLLGGTVLNVTVDVPPGTPIDQIPLPDLGGLVVKVTGPDPAAPAPTTTTTAVPAAPPTTTAATTPTTTAAPPAATTPAAPAAPTKRTPKQAADSSAKAKAKAKAKAEAKAKADRRARREQSARKAAASGATAKGAADGAVSGSGAATRESGGAPTPADPTFAESIPGPTPRGVPNFFIDKFRIPPFLLPIYQAAGIQYGVPWQVLAAINEIETDYGRNLDISSAGAEGWMQFMPETWKAYGVDANGDGQADPFNPVDAIFAAARYLKAAGADKDIKKAVFAYNHADWYVDSVMLRARVIGGLPPDLVGSLTGLTQGEFPVAAKATYAGDDANRKARARTGKAAAPISSSSRRQVEIYSRPGAAAVAVQDGRIVKVGSNPRLGRFVQLRDVYGNVYTYGNLKRTATSYPVPTAAALARADARSSAAAKDLQGHDPAPTAAATAGTQQAPAAAKAAGNAPSSGASLGAASPEAPVAGRSSLPIVKPLFAHPAAGATAAVETAERTAQADASTTSLRGWKRDEVHLKRLRKGAQVLAGTVLGRLGKTSRTSSPHLRFEIHPAGKGSPRVDPKPILDGWKLLETTAVYRAKGSNPLFGGGDATAGQVLLMSKEQLQRRVLADDQLDIYPQGRQDIEAGAIDRRVLATMEYLVASGLRLSISSLRSGHGLTTESGNVSEHASGNAFDISAVNGIPITPKTQGPGSITEQTIQQLLQLQGTMKPHQIISLMTFKGADNTLYLPSHSDHIHVGFRPQGGTDAELGKQVAQVLKPGQWIKLIDRIGEIDNPTVSATPSKYAVKATRRRSPESGR